MVSIKPLHILHFPLSITPRGAFASHQYKQSREELKAGGGTTYPPPQRKDGTLRVAFNKNDKDHTPEPFGEHFIFIKGISFNSIELLTAAMKHDGKPGYSQAKTLQRHCCICQRWVGSLPFVWVTGFVSFARIRGKQLFTCAICTGACQPKQLQT